MRTLRLNAKGDDVADWQRFLQSSGFPIAAIDGTFDINTLEATKAFQTANALVVDGIVGNRTLGRAMQLGFDLVPDDTAVSGGGQDGAAFTNDAWQPPPPPVTANMVIARDPRMDITHVVGTLPCPRTPPPPIGWAYWKGGVPPNFSRFAKAVQGNRAEYPIGSFVQALIDGRLVAARVEWHDYQGLTGRRGCFQGTSLFSPRAAGP